MTGRERLIRVYRGKLADRIPWAPIMDDKTLSEYDEQTRKNGVIDFTRRIGADILGRSCIVMSENKSCERSNIADAADPSIISMEYRTKLGVLKGKNHGHSIIEPLLHDPESFNIYRHIYDNFTYALDIDKFYETEKQVGAGGVTAVPISATPVQALVQNQMGVEAFNYALCDYPAEMEELMGCMHKKNKEAYKLAAQSPAEIFILVENTSISMISPEIYAKYSMGHVRDFVDIMHANGKIAIIHMCGLINNLLPLIKQTGLDGIDCLTPPPTGNTFFRDAYRVIGGHLVIHGMLDPTAWLPGSVTTDAIAANIDNLLEPGIINKPYVFCTASDGMPGVPLEKYEAIRNKLGEYVF